MQRSKDTEAQSAKPGRCQGVTEKLQREILKTIIYADIFDYPLTALEVCEFLISDTEVREQTVRQELQILVDCKRILTDLSASSGQVYTDGEFYFLKGRENIIEVRENREEWSKKKLEIAQKTAGKLKIIPTIKMIGITGALAMNNCKEDDDIDLLVVASENSLWLTRLLIIIMSPFLGIKRRKPKEKNIKDKICFNLFLEEKHLIISPENFFLAHETAQVKPIYDKGGVYEKFLGENKWVRNYLPNIPVPNNLTIKQFNNLRKRNKIAILLSCHLAFFEKLTFYIQYLYMQPKITCEKVSLYQAFFHPNDLSEKIERIFKDKCSKLGLDNC